MSQNNQRPDGFSRPDESGSWQDEPQQNLSLIHISEPTRPY